MSEFNRNTSKKVLIVAAHSDDEVLGCGGTIAKHTEYGDKVYVVFMTNGVGSRYDTSKKDIDQRDQAAKKASKTLGVSSTKLFDFPDNKMDTVPLLDIVQSIEAVINEFKPDIIYTHHIGDLNIDHQITHNAVMTACRPQPGFCVKEIYTFEVPSSTEWQTPKYFPFAPNMFVDIGKQIEIKKAALAFYGDEMRLPPHSRSIQNILRINAYRGNSMGVDYAEAFVVNRILKI